MRIFYDNKADDATLTASTQDFNYPVANLQNFVLAKKFRTTGITSENVVFDNSGMTASKVIIIGHNFTSSVSVKLQGNDTDVWTSPSLDETLTYSSGMIIGEFTEATYNFWRILVADPTNTNSYLEISRVFIGGVLEMPAMSRGQNLPSKTTGQQSFSTGQVLFGRKGRKYQNAKISTPFFDFDKKREIDEMFDTVQGFKPVILQIWENELTNQPSIYCAIRGDTIPHQGNDNGANKWKTDFEFSEVF